LLFKASSHSRREEMSIKRAIILHLTAIIIALLPSVPAFSVPILDQYQNGSSGGAEYWLDRSLAQTFTAGYSMQLHHIEVQMDAWSDPPTYPTTVEIRATVSGMPTGAVLGSVYVPDGFAWGWDSIDFLSDNVFLTAGNMYAIVFWNNDPNNEVNTTNAVSIAWSPNAYTAGELLGNTGSGWSADNPGVGDMAFRTYMIPEPGTALLVGLGGLVVLRKRRT
jgi:hypothetical protein